MASKAMLKKAAEIEARLAALDGPEWDSDDDAPEAAPASPTAAPEAPAPKLGRKAKKRAAAERREREEKSRVIYIGHVPDGFFEDQMRGFFGQFGEVTNLRISRSKKTGNSKGYGFVEFADHDSALRALRHLNNNPALFHACGASKPTDRHRAPRGDAPLPRPIVAFAVENVKKARQRADRVAEGRRCAPAARHRLVVHLLQSGAQRRGELGVGAGEAALVRGEGRQRGDGHAWRSSYSMRRHRSFASAGFVVLPAPWPP